jgi:hypothetical protein
LAAVDAQLFVGGPLLCQEASPLAGMQDLELGMKKHNMGL